MLSLLWESEPAMRSLAAAGTAFVLCVLAGGRVIDWLKRLGTGGAESARTYLPATHRSKAGTPSRGGVLIIGVVCLATALWAGPAGEILIALGAMLAYGATGWLDDSLKARLGTATGLRPRYKLALQGGIALIAVILVVSMQDPQTRFLVFFPWVPGLALNLGVGFFLFGVLVLVGSSNAVNLTDGLDGLAAGIVAIVAAGLAVCALGPSESGQSLYSEEASVFAGALAGACAGFLWFNAWPARVFMGDTGSLALGGGLGIFALITRYEIALAVAGGVLVAETLSVIVQIGSLRLLGRRVFLMTPLHHHFEKKQWHENTITLRFWLVTLVLTAIAMTM